MPNVVNYAERWEPELLEIISQMQENGKRILNEVVGGYGKRRE